MEKKKGFSQWVEELSSKTILVAGSTLALVLSFLFVAAWGLSGVILHFSSKWEGIISTVSAVITFMMVFLIQKSQNKHSLSIQLKLNELVAANEKASNRLVNVEGMTQDELKVIEKYYSKLGEFAKKEANLQQSHSIDEIHNQHSIKQEMEQELTEVKSSGKK